MFPSRAWWVWRVASPALVGAARAGLLSGSCRIAPSRVSSEINCLKTILASPCSSGRVVDVATNSVHGDALLTDSVAEPEVKGANDNASRNVETDAVDSMIPGDAKETGAETDNASTIVTDSASIASDAAPSVSDAVQSSTATADAAIHVAADAPIHSASDAAATPPSPPPPLSSLHVHRLSDRALIRLEGPDSQDLLQGLVTQDVAMLDTTPVIYTMMLNLQGRVLYDVIIYNLSPAKGTTLKYLVECDASIAPELTSHLKKYKLRKSCDIHDVSDVYDVFSVRPTTERMAGVSSLPRKSEFAETFDPIVKAVRDPRLKEIGWRVISGQGSDVAEALGGGAVDRPLTEYREQRYKLGVAEGVADLEPGKAFPLESNLVFLNGVSFSKGCYLGQELTARTHHTGVIRKRIMPLILSTPVSENGPFQDNLILNTTGKDAGKFRNGVGEHGIGLVRVNMSGGRLIIVGKNGESECYARVPQWWPMDDPVTLLASEEADTEEVEKEAVQPTS